MTREAVVRLVRRGRLRLDAMRLLRAGARGALAGGAAGLAILLAGKFWPDLGVGSGWPWVLLGAGALAGLVRAGRARRIGLAATALFLDRQLSTDERIVTLVTRAPDRFGDHLLLGLEGVRALPRLPFPREISLVPAALFLLFAAGMLPGADRAAVARVSAQPRAVPGAIVDPAPLPDLSGPIARLRRGQSPRPEELADIRAAIARGLHRPEDRRAAEAALKEASEGDGAAAREVAKGLEALQAGRGQGAGAAPAGATEEEPAAHQGRSGTAYPDMRELVLAYRRALVEERNR